MFFFNRILRKHYIQIHVSIYVIHKSIIIYCLCKSQTENHFRNQNLEENRTITFAEQYLPSSLCLHIPYTLHTSIPRVGKYGVA